MLAYGKTWFQINDFSTLTSSKNKKIEATAEFRYPCLIQYKLHFYAAVLSANLRCSNAAIMSVGSDTPLGFSYMVQNSK